MAIAETQSRNELTPPVSEALEVLNGNYDTYWQQFGELYGGDIQITAENNQRKQIALTSRLYDPPKHTGNRFVDSLSPADVAEEWYLGIGSLNKLTGSSAAMLLAAATLWENPDPRHLPDPKIATRFITELGTMRRGQTPERMERALSDPGALAHIGLAGQVTLDIARIPDEGHIDERLLAADLSFQINHGLFKILVDKPDISSAQKRVLSDSLKAQHDAKLEYLDLRRSKGELSDSDYEATYNQTLAEQIHDTLKASNRMTNGDLYEHYYLALMRYALNTWQEQTNYKVSSTTRRQDEPHDKFAPKHLPKFSYDAIIIEPNKGTVELVQLKTSQEPDSLPYANGIDVLDDILTPDTSNIDMRNEIMTGLSQMRGLIREVLIGEPYKGKDTVIRSHIAKIFHNLSL